MYDIGMQYLKEHKYYSGFFYVLGKRNNNIILVYSNNRLERRVCVGKMYMRKK